MPRLLIFALFMVGLFSGTFLEAEEERPNVIVILTDDQGYSDVGIYGAQGFDTPNLDRMALEGMRFTCIS